MIRDAFTDLIDDSINHPIPDHPLAIGIGLPGMREWDAIISLP